MKKIIALILGFALSLSIAFSISLPAAAAFCRTSGERTICILEIKRSAKNHWEYRAAVKVNGEERPIEVYNCRDRVRIQQDGTAIPFQSNGAGDLICRVLNRAHSN
jgi:hypothetical protein